MTSNSRGSPRERPPGPRAYLPFAFCDSALAAADFAVLLDFGFDRTFDAAVAAFAPVWRVFRATIFIS